MAINSRTMMRRTHRWLGLLIGIQLLLWTISGFYFSLKPIAEVRGETQVQDSAPDNFSFTALQSPAIAIAAMREQWGPSIQVRGLKLDRLLERPVYHISYSHAGNSHVVLADALNGTLLPAINEAMATKIAEHDFAPEAAVRQVQLIENVEDGAQYRGGPLPAWKISFEHDSNTDIYVSAETGRVTARRNTTWRIFDFLWMLHILDFENRDNFNTLLLQVAAALGVITIVSGFILWCMTTTLFQSQRPKART